MTTEVFEGLMSLVKRRLVQVRFSDDGKLALFKYHRKVFYDALWGEDPLLLQARGHVFSTETHELVVNPFDKVFNYGERGAGEDIPPNELVIAERKVNGFMASATHYNGKLLVTTTGSFESPFVDLARKHLCNPNIERLAAHLHGHTILFEIVDESDPHIIKDHLGAWYLGHRRNEPLSPMDGVVCDRPEMIGSSFHIPLKLILPYGEALEMAKNADHEGFMIKTAKTPFRYICKVKSRLYLGLKLMARAKRLFEPGRTKQQLRMTMEEEFFPVLDFIFDTYGQEAFLALDEQSKLELLRNNL